MPGFAQPTSLHTPDAWTEGSIAVARLWPNVPRAPPRKLIDLSEAELKKLRDPHAKYLKFVKDYRKYDHDAADLFHHRGVVMVGGGEFYGPAIISIKMLRDTGSNLPVEVFVANWHEYEPYLCEEYLPTLNAKCLVLDDFLADHAAGAGASRACASGLGIATELKVASETLVVSEKAGQCFPARDFSFWRRKN